VARGVQAPDRARTDRRWTAADELPRLQGRMSPLTGTAHAVPAKPFGPEAPIPLIPSASCQALHMDWSLPISLVAVLISALSAWNSWRSRRIAESTSHLARAPRYSVDWNGRFDTQARFTFAVDRDLDTLHLSLQQNLANDDEAPWHELVCELEPQATFDQQGVHFSHGVTAGKRYAMQVRLHSTVKDVPEFARFVIRCRATKGDEDWVSVETTDRVQVGGPWQKYPSLRDL